MRQSQVFIPKTRPARRVRRMWQMEAKFSSNCLRLVRGNGLSRRATLLLIWPAFNLMFTVASPSTSRSNRLQTLGCFTRCLGYQLGKGGLAVEDSSDRPPLLAS